MLHAYPDLVDMSDVPVHVPEVDKDLFPAHIPGDPRIDGNSYQLYPTLEEYRRSSEPGEGATGDPTLATKEKGGSSSKPWSATSPRWSWRHESTRCGFGTFECPCSVALRAQVTPCKALEGVEHQMQ